MATLFDFNGAFALIGAQGGAFGSPFVIPVGYFLIGFTDNFHGSIVTGSYQFQNSATKWFYVVGGNTVDFTFLGLLYGPININAL